MKARWYSPLLFATLMYGCTGTTNTPIPPNTADGTPKSTTATTINIFTEESIQVEPVSLLGIDRQPLPVNFSKYSRTILYFWASWDQSSLEHLRDFDQAAKESKAKAQIIAINVFENTAPGASEPEVFDSSATATTNAKKDQSLSIPMACYGDRLAKEWSIGGVPTLVIVDREGKLVGAQTTINRDIIRKAVLQ